MNKVEVFRTNVSERWQARVISEKLQEQIQGLAVHFDLEDHEKILRVEAQTINANQVISLLHYSGFTCEVLED